MKLLCQAADGARDGHARGVNGSHAEALRDFRNSPLNLHARDDELAVPGTELGERIEIAVKYAGYIARQEAEAARVRRLQEQRLPIDLDYAQVPGLRTEARQRLAQFRPATIGQAGRIYGVTPADVAVLLIRVRGRR